LRTSPLQVIVGCDKIPQGYTFGHGTLIAALAANEAVTLQLIDSGPGQEAALLMFSHDPAGAIAAAKVVVSLSHVAHNIPAKSALDAELRSTVPASSILEANRYVERLRTFNSHHSHQGVASPQSKSTTPHPPSGSPPSTKIIHRPVQAPDAR